MTPLRAEELRSIKSFPQLVRYLRDELEWPIEQESFDDLTFDYAPEEFGLDEKVAAKVREIKQLRPLVTGQPWAFFSSTSSPRNSHRSAAPHPAGARDQEACLREQVANGGMAGA